MILCSWRAPANKMKLGHLALSQRHKCSTYALVSVSNSVTLSVTCLQRRLLALGPSALEP